MDLRSIQKDPGPNKFFCNFLFNQPNKSTLYMRVGWLNSLALSLGYEVVFERASEKKVTREQGMMNLEIEWYKDIRKSLIKNSPDDI